MLTTVGNVRDGFSADDYYIGRRGRGFDGYFGNPYTIPSDGDRAEVIDKYSEWFHLRIGQDATFRHRVHLLRGKRLLCFCAPQACHGDVIADYLNGRPDAEIT